MCISLGYPNSAAERKLLAGEDRRELLAKLQPALGPDDLLGLQQQVDAVHVADALLDYVQAILEYSREAPDFSAGLSPRAGIGLVRAARAWAAFDGRDMVIPEDVQAVLPSVVVHRVRGQETDQHRGAQMLVDNLLAGVPIP